MHFFLTSMLIKTCPILLRNALTRSYFPEREAVSVRAQGQKADEDAQLSAASHLSA